MNEFVETFGDNERDNVLTSLANEIWYIYRNINENSLTEEYSEIINSFVQYFTAILKGSEFTKIEKNSSLGEFIRHGLK